MSIRAFRVGWVMPLLGVMGTAMLGACGQPKPAQDPSFAGDDTGADPAQPASSAAPPASGPSLYVRLGKRDALAGVVEELMGDVLADNRIAKLFDKTRKDKNRAHQLSVRLTAELCVVASGGDECAYDGKSMKDAHAGMNINGAQWDAFVEDLSIALKTRGIDDAASKELIDKLTQQTRGDIVAPATPKAK